MDGTGTRVGHQDAAPAHGKEYAQPQSGGGNQGQDCVAIGQARGGTQSFGRRLFGATGCSQTPQEFRVSLFVGKRCSEFKSCCLPVTNTLVVLYLALPILSPFKKGSLASGSFEQIGNECGQITGGVGAWGIAV